MATHTRSRKSSIAALIRDNRLFLILLVPALILRVLATAAYHPGLFFLGDSDDYIDNAFNLVPQIVHPLGYAVLIHIVLVFHDLTLVALVQHLLGMGTAIISYVVLRHLKLPAWLAAVGTLFVLFDPLQLVLEENFLSECLFQFLLVAAMAILVWSRHPTVIRMLAAGVVLALAAVTRNVGLFLILPAVGYAVGRRLGWRRIATLVVAFALPIIAYAGWFDSLYGRFNLEDYSGITLYGRVAPFADCHGPNLSSTYHDLCPTSQTSPWPTQYVFASPSPFDRLPTASRKDLNGAGTNFAVTTILRQPTTYVADVSKDLLDYFHFDRVTGPDANPAQVDLVFRSDGLGNFQSPQINQTIELADGSRTAQGSLNHGLAEDLSVYQQHFYFPGPLFALALILAFTGALLGRRSTDPPLSAEGLLFGTSAVLLLVIPVATVVFDFRWLVPALPLLGMGGVIGGFQLFRRFGHHPPPRQPRSVTSSGRVPPRPSDLAAAQLERT